mmetsp:Transcript_18607/g.45787  ORF Transcript_18607/g.45787 Transcript_18607/m.45787 type:complete len:116 (-) Transcript_18607:1291-1638(-)
MYEELMPVQLLGEGAPPQAAGPAMVLSFEVELETLRERLLARGETSGRDDDNAQIIEKRFRTFTKTTYPVIQHYQRQGTLHPIDGGRSVDQVYASVRAVIDQSFPLRPKPHSLTL